MRPNEITIDGVTLEHILEQHNLWLECEGGERANLENLELYDVNLNYVNLEGANLAGANLEGANLIGTNLRYANLRGANLIGANLADANLRGANLIGANLKMADLEEADLDFSCMPLWCGDLTANYDDKQIIQQLYHVLNHIKNSKNASSEIKELLNETNLKWANKFHRVGECEEIKKED